LLARAAGSGALHVVLGPAMDAALRRRYPAIRETMVLSNAALIEAPEAQEISRATEAAQTVGLLANLSAAKGLDDFVALAEASHSRGLPWRFILAGPFESKAEGDRMSARIRALPNLDYRGPVYGEAKAALLREIDVFVFPTRYRNEAEPLVVLEAMSQGRPVIAYGRGCIADMLENSGGQVVPVGSEFVGPALEALEAWRKEGAFRLRRESARRRFAELREQGTQSLQVLLSRLGAIHS
jgi:glycosyltransferase involved in cell wall biosynthesis